MLDIREDVSLKQYSTMRLGGKARFLCEVSNEEELIQAISFANEQPVRLKVIGTGSNLVWSDNGFDGLIIVNRIEHYKEQTDGTVIIGAGMSWDAAVAKSVSSGLSGIEMLSLIPGTTGATPVQNVGAYGREISDVLLHLRAFDSKEDKFVSLTNNECAFGYRSSRFNREDAGRFIITEITLALTKELPKPPFYASLQKYLDDQRVIDFSPQIIRDAVIAVRSSKLPDPDIIANNGSFFANPIITVEQHKSLVREHPDMVAWTTESGVKLSAAWLIEQSGYKDFHDANTGMATWHKQPLVLINEHATSSDDLQSFKNKIVQAVKDKFSVTLIQEPEFVE